MDSDRLQGDEASGIEALGVIHATMISSVHFYPACGAYARGVK